MKNEAEQLKEYFDGIEPSEAFLQRLQALEETTVPQPRASEKKYLWRYALAAAAALLLGIFSWRTLDRLRTDPVLPDERTDRPAAIEPAAPAENPAAPADRPEQTPPSASVSAPKTPTEPPETVEPATTGDHAGLAPTVPPTVSPPPTVQPTAPPTEQPPEPTEELPPVEPVEPVEPTEDIPDNTGDAPAISEEEFVGLYELVDGRELITIYDESSGESAVLDVTGQVIDGQYQGVHTLFGKILSVALQCFQGGGYEVVVTVLN